MGDNRNGEDMEQAYMMKDIDKISTRLGIPWERSKDVLFGSRCHKYKYSLQR